jgi:hypothetical protein
MRFKEMMRRLLKRQDLGCLVGAIRLSRLGTMRDRKKFPLQHDRRVAEHGRELCMVSRCR